MGIRKKIGTEKKGEEDDGEHTISKGREHA